MNDPPPPFYTFLSSKIFYLSCVTYEVAYEKTKKIFFFGQRLLIELIHQKCNHETKYQSPKNNPVWECWLPEHRAGSYRSTLNYFGVGNSRADKWRRERLKKFSSTEVSVPQVLRFLAHFHEEKVKAKGVHSSIHSQPKIAENIPLPKHFRRALFSPPKESTVIDPETSSKKLRSRLCSEKWPGSRPCFRAEKNAFLCVPLLTRVFLNRGEYRFRKPDRQMLCRFGLHKRRRKIKRLEGKLVSLTSIVNCIQRGEFRGVWNYMMSQVRPNIFFNLFYTFPSYTYLSSYHSFESINHLKNSYPNMYKNIWIEIMD